MNYNSMEALKKMLNNFLSLQRNDIFFRTMNNNPQLKKLAVKLNQQQLYNAIVASPDLLRDRPEAVRRFLLAFTRGLRYVLEHPAEALHACADEIGLRSSQLELERLRLLLREVIDSEGARSEGFGHVNLPRLREMAQRGVTLNGGSPVSASAVWDDRFLPPSAELNLLPQVRA